MKLEAGKVDANELIYWLESNYKGRASVEALVDRIRLMAEQPFNASSSNGRTPDFDSGNRGSNPREATTFNTTILREMVAKSESAAQAFAGTDFADYTQKILLPYIKEIAKLLEEAGNANNT